MLSNMSKLKKNGLETKLLLRLPYILKNKIIATDIAKLIQLTILSRKIPGFEW